MIRRLFVEKKSLFSINSEQLRRDLNENFDINIKTVRILNRYDIENISNAHFESAKRYIFSEPMVDEVFENQFPADPGDRVFAMAYLPGQYNQRADSAIQCLQIMTHEENYNVETASIFVLNGDITDTVFAKIKAYLINAIDSYEVDVDEPLILNTRRDIPPDVENLDGFIEKTDRALSEWHAQNGLAMRFEDLKLVQDYFKKHLLRNPTITEIRVLDTYWSDHCRHTTFLTHIDHIAIENGHYTQPIQQAYEAYLQLHKDLYAGKQRGVCLMDIATIGMKALKKQGKLNDLDESPEINACSIKVDVDVNGVKEPWLVMFKNETHNHPTEIEPFGGAATCLGGAIRDPLSGRSYVYQAVRVTGSGDPRTPISETLPGKLPQKKITVEAAHGFSSYGNQIGLATGHVEEIYDSGFIAKRMEIGAVVGAAPAKNVVREVPSVGDRVILVGGRTGRDGCGGATGSSKAHTEQSLHKSGAEVQKGNPVIERKIQRLFRNPNVSTLIKRCNDFGAGGVSVAVGELADGLDINLDLVTKKYDGLDGTELAISESQERMAVVVSAENADHFIALCRDENLEATAIAAVTDEKRVRMRWRGKTIVDLPRALLDTNGAKQCASATVCAPDADNGFFKPIEINPDVKRAWLDCLGDLNVCSQKGLVERFDASIGACTVLMPFGGKTQLTPSEAAVSKIPVQTGETNTATIMAHGYTPALSAWSPFHGAVYAVVETLAKITACGGDYTKTHLSFQEYFERLEQDDKKWGKPLSGLLGALYAQMQAGVPAIGGKDSMSGTFKNISVPPVVAAFGLCVADANVIISPEFKQINSHVVYLPLQRDAYDVPDFNALHKTYAVVHKLIASGKIRAAHTVKTHGLSEAVSKMCFGNMIGVQFNPIDDNLLFAPGFGSLLVEISENEDVVALLEGLEYHIVAKTQAEPFIQVNGVQISLDEALDAWQKTLEPIFPSKTDIATNETATPHQTRLDLNPATYGGPKFAKPRVFIPVFPGTNCEYDSRTAFEKAGAEVETLVFKNLNANDIISAISEMKKAIDQCQILMLSGGFSAGDEPDGSAKFITVVFRNEAVRHALHALLKERDGLALGVCNGFQALIKLGLLTHGEITDTNAASPTLTYNKIGRHVSQIVATKIISARSPWLYGVKEGDRHMIPVSHGEGRFIANAETLERLYKNDQIATVYDDCNPNGSIGAVEGITSPCGRIFGKMGHSERIGRNVYKNISGNNDQKIFKSGVKYFS